MHRSRELGRELEEFLRKDVLCFSIVAFGLSTTYIGYEWDFSVTEEDLKGLASYILSSFDPLHWIIMTNLH